MKKLFSTIIALSILTTMAKADPADNISEDIQAGEVSVIDYLKDVHCEQNLTFSPNISKGKAYAEIKKNDVGYAVKVFRVDNQGNENLLLNEQTQAYGEDVEVFYVDEEANVLFKIWLDELDQSYAVIGGKVLHFNCTHPYSEE